MFKGRPKEPTPPGLPPETRPIGQLVAEGIRLYGSRFWPSLALGVPIAGYGALRPSSTAVTRSSWARPRARCW